MALKKLKLNKSFQPLPCEVDEEFFPNGLFEFNITKLLKHINANPDQFQAQEVDVKTARAFPSTNLDKATIKSANLSNPIILAEISPGQFNVIDGRHRLEKAHNEGLSKILAYRIFAEQHVAFLTSVMAYTAYVDYWNGKLKSQIAYYKTLA